MDNGLLLKNILKIHGMVIALFLIDIIGLLYMCLHPAFIWTVIWSLINICIIFLVPMITLVITVIMVNKYFVKSEHEINPKALAYITPFILSVLLSGILLSQESALMRHIKDYNYYIHKKEFNVVSKEIWKKYNKPGNYDDVYKLKADYPVDLRGVDFFIYYDEKGIKHLYVFYRGYADFPLKGGGYIYFSDNDYISTFFNEHPQFKFRKLEKGWYAFSAKNN
jgi:hypothetical protein